MYVYLRLVHVCEICSDSCWRDLTAMYVEFVYVCVYEIHARM